MKKIAVFLFILMILLLASCAKVGTVPPTDGPYDTYFFVDEETGVNYIIARSSTGNGVSVSITPRYKADGTLYVSRLGM